MKEFIINNCTAWINKKFVKRSFYIQNNLLKKISQKPIINKNVPTFDCANLTMIPGLIDIHTHLRHPGFEYKETIKTGTQAAAHGGYTTICCMPNLNPPTDSVKNIVNLQKLINHDALINVYPYASITKQRKIDSPIVDMDKLTKYCFAFSNDGSGVETKELMYQAMINAKKVNKTIVAHAEDLDLIPKGASVHEGINVKKFNLIGIPSSSEYSQVQRDVELAIKTKCKYHVCHISSKQTLDIINKAHKLNRNITCEVTPHHLLLNENSITKNHGKFKMNPPLRTKQDQLALIQGIKNNSIQIIASDHAPHALSEKNTTIDKAAFGITTLDYCFPLLYTKLVKTKIISFNKLIELMSINPSRIFNLPSNEIKLNKPFNVTIVDLNKSKKINPKEFFSKGKSTPFENINCYGWPKLTICNGLIVYQDKGVKYE